jgi:hypothetical protein
MRDDRDTPEEGPERGSEQASGPSPEDLAARITQLSRNEPDRLAAEVAGLSVRQQAELALRLPALERQELLLHAPRPMRVVRALPDADLYLTVREIGPSDAMPLLALASTEQIRHLVDLEAWRGDRFDGKRCGAWVALLLEAGEPTVRRFLRHADEELLALLFRHWIRVEQMEYEDSPEVHGHGESETGSERGFVTPDGYHRFSPAIAEHAAAIRGLLQLFYQELPERYQRAIWAAQWELPAELEEAALKWRDSRLEEHGFPRRDEALSIYAPPEGARNHPVPPEAIDRDGLGSARSLLPLLTGQGPLAAAVGSLSGPTRERTLHGLVSLANHLLVADTADTGEPAAHRRALQKAAGYLRVALAERGAADPSAAARVLEEIPVAELFREGYAAAVALQQRARDLVGQGWAAAHPNALELLDEPLRDRVLGLLSPRPLYAELDDAGTTLRLRDFGSPQEISDTGVALEMAEIVGRILVDGLGLDVQRVLDSADGADATPLRFSAIVLTVLAWHATRAELRGDPLPSDVTADFLRGVASRRTAASDAPARAMAALTTTLAGRFGLQPREISVIEAFGRFCLEQLAAECGSLDPGVPIDRRYVSCLLLES